MRAYCKWTAIGVALVLLIPAGLWAQGGATGAITGVVQDEKGAVIPNAKVVVVNKATGVTEREVTTTGAGTFNVPLLPPSAYRLEITAEGFAKFVAESVLVRVTDTSSVVVTLKVGPMTQTVTVTEVVIPIVTTSAVTGQTIGAFTVSTLPLPTRNFL